MRILFSLALLTISVTPLAAQELDADCRPKPLHGYVMAPLPQDPECLRQKARAAAADQARQQEALRRQADEQAREQAFAAAQVRAQVAAETSPTNKCREPDVARHLIDSYNSMDWPTFLPRKVVDIEHLVTVRQDPGAGVLSCHGVWIHTDERQIEGTMTFRPNVAGDIIVSWDAGAWTPPVDMSVVAAAVPTTAASAPNNPVPASASFQDGLTARQSWESWVQQISGDQKAGAIYWASHRSLPHPGSCAVLVGDAVHGCEEAKARLTSSDAMRKADPDYRRGWNSLVVTAQ